MVDVGMMQVTSRRVWLHGLPALAIIQLHPVVFPVFDFAGALESLSKELAKIIVVRSVFKSKVSDIAEVLVELL